MYWSSACGTKRSVCARVTGERKNIFFVSVECRHTNKQCIDTKKTAKEKLENRREMGTFDERLHLSGLTLWVCSHKQRRYQQRNLRTEREERY
jgi:hypothetical protein